MVLQTVSAVLYFLSPWLGLPHLLQKCALTLSYRLSMLAPPMCHDDGRNVCLGLDADRLLPMSQLPPRSGEPTTYAPRLTSLQVYLATWLRYQLNHQQHPFL